MQYVLEFMRKVMLETRKYDRMTEINKSEFCEVIMFRKMRRFKQQLSDEECIAVLKTEMRCAINARQ